MPASYPPILGLTGGIGAGKSAVAAILADLGCVVVDSDQLGKEALLVPEIREKLVRWWGSEILNKSGEIDRKAVAGIIFSDSDQRRRLEALVHPWIEAKRVKIFQDAPRETPALVIDAPLLLEAGLGGQCDAVIFVDASPEVRAERVCRSHGWDASELSRREASQWPLDEKRSKADDIIRNDGNLEALAEQVARILKKVVTSRRT